ncbi:nuclease [Brevundimonas sp.]|uniref:thermonuclease family protein n=1 Tax=Brevundimonas sp. TaxID=1871086 RepID=UPI00289FDD6C|nr:nuclease [Brevundimonas sp.]
MNRWLFLPLFAAPAIAHADPCEGRLPNQAGQAFPGVVRYVGDGDGLCVGDSANPATCIAVRLADFNAAALNAPGGRDARDQLRRLVMGRHLDCVATPGRSGRVIVYDRVIATCHLNGRRVGPFESRWSPRRRRLTARPVPGDPAEENIFRAV